MQDNLKEEQLEEVVNKNKYYKKEREFNELVRTNFLRSFLFLIFEFFIPFLSLWFLVGNDFHFSFKINFSINIVLLFVELIFSLLLTLLFYFLKQHKSDQFTYVIALQFAALMIYISAFFWKYHLFYRLILSFSVLLVGILIGAFISSLFYNHSLKNKSE